MSKQIFTRRTLGTTGANDRFCHPFGGGMTAWSSLQVPVQSRVSAPGTLSNLRVQNSVVPGVGISAIYTVMVNGVASALSAVITHPAISGQDTLNTATIAAGDLLSLRRSTSGGNPATATVQIALEFDGTTAGESQYGGPLDLVNNTSPGYFNPTACPGTTESTNIEHTIAVWPIAGTVTRLDIIKHSSNIGNAQTIALIKNGVTQDGSGGTVDTRVTFSHPTLNGFSTFSLPMVAGDTLSMVHIPTGTTTGSPLMAVGFAFTATTAGEFAICVSPDNSVFSTGPGYSAGSGEIWSSTIGTYRNIGSVTPLQLVGIRGLLLNGSDDGRTLGLVKNGVLQGAPIATFTGGGTTAIAGETVTITSSDTWEGYTAPGTFLRRMIYAIPAIAEEEPPNGEEEPEPEGGGEVAQGPQPEDGAVPTFPLLFARFKDVNGAHAFVFAETWLNDDFQWYGGQKAGKITNVSPITRRLSRHGAFDGVRCTVTLADADREFRDFVHNSPMRGTTVELFLIDDASRRAASGPTTPPAFRIFCGRITGYAAAAGFLFTFELLDILSQRLAEFNKQPMIPPDALTAVQFPGMDPALEGRAAPIVIGRVTDIDGDVINAAGPQGAVPMLRLVGSEDAGFNLSQIGGINHSVDVYLLTRGAIPHGGIFDGFYNEPDQPRVRLEIPEDAYGVHLWVPHKPGWTAGTGQALHYIVYQGGTYTPVFISRTVTIGALNVAQAIRDGRMLVAWNMVGIDETGTSEGRYIDYPPRIWQWLLQNYVFNRYTTGPYHAMPLLEGTYGVIDWQSVEAAVAAQLVRIPERYLSGFILGGDGRQRAVFDILGELCQGSDMDQGINRHGQLMLSVEVLSAPPAIVYDATLDIEEEQFEMWIEDAEMTNRIEQYFGAVYLPPSAPNPVPVVGQPTPTQHQDYPEFQSGIVIDEDTQSQTLVNEISTVELKNYVTRLAPTANDIGMRMLWRGTGLALDGPRKFRFTGGYRLLGEDDVIVELGTVIGYKHPEKIGDIDIVDTGRVMSMTVDPIRKRVTLEGIVLSSAQQTILEFTPLAQMALGGEFGGELVGAMGDMSGGFFAAAA